MNLKGQLILDIYLQQNDVDDDGELGEHGRLRSHLIVPAIDFQPVTPPASIPNIRAAVFSYMLKAPNYYLSVFVRFTWPRDVAITAETSQVDIQCDISKISDAEPSGDFYVKQRRSTLSVEPVFVCQHPPVSAENSGG